MDKTEFTIAIKEFRTKLTELKKAIEVVKNKQIHSKVLLQQIETIATNWFDGFESTLRHFYSIDPEVIERYHERFGRLLECSTITPSKSVVVSLLEEIEKGISADLLLRVLKFQSDVTRLGSLSNILNFAQGAEVEYLKEAVECAERGYFRAAIVLCWCAAVDRLQKKIMEIGLDKFNQASTQMSAITSGQYRRFNKKFVIHNLSDLRMSVLDNDLLWVLEFLGVLDGNEHEKLAICFTLRNTCAHPGDTSPSPENVISFFSDINQHIFQNTKLSLI